MNIRAQKILVALGAAFLLASPAIAHNAPSRHGGTVRAVGDIQFELVQRGDDAVIHVEDHGKPVPTAGMAGTLTVLRGTEKSEMPLQPAGENRLEAKGAKLGSGAKAVAVVTADKKKTITVRFAVK